jgi:hypothetical protein
MNVFVAYGYNQRDSWIRELVCPLVSAFGHTVLTGERMEGEDLSAGVVERISASDAMLGFLTRRGEGDVYDTHRWVSDEIAVAIGAGITVVEIRETNVDQQGGIAGNRQRMTYDEARRDHFLVDLAEVLGGWASRKSRNLRLLPPDVVAAIRPHTQKQGFRCTYSGIKDGKFYPEIEAVLVRKEGGLYLMAKDVHPGMMIQIRVQAAGNSWTSDHIDLDSLSVELMED